MKLKFELNEKQLTALELENSEVIRYCVPYDLAYDFDAREEVSSFETKEGYFVVTNKKMIVLRGLEKACEYDLKNCKNIKCESMVGCGMITAKVDGEAVCILRFSMRHIERIAYVAKGADHIANGENIEITSNEYERYCEKCHRALPGTKLCPYCSGKATMLKKVWALCKEFKWKFLLVSLFTLLMSFLEIIIPEIQKSFIDNVLVKNNAELSAVYIFIAVMITINAVKIVLDVIKYWFNASLGGKISMSLRKKLYDKIQKLSLSFINKRKPGELMNRVASDTVKIRQFMEEVFNGMFTVLVVMAAAFVGMLIINFKLALASSVLLVSVFIIIKAFFYYIRKIFHIQWIKDDKVRNGLQDVISGMRVVKAFGREQYESERFKKLTDEFARIQKKNETFWAVFYPMITFIMGMGTYIAVFFGGRDVINGSMTSGELVQFITYAGLLFGELGWMTHLPRSIMSLITSINRIYDVLDEEPSIVNVKKPIQETIKGDIEFNDISFGYSSYEPVLEHISLKVNKGEMIGIVGASGTGKSTLINLIMRLYDVDAGIIKIDNTDIKDFDTACLHSQIGVVLQETFLFSGTILNNIKFAKPDATMEEIIKAAKAANAHDFICKMPDGYDTYVGEHGYKLSGGERQRIAIARAILTDPKLLILDEATSALDTESEYLIQQALNRLIEGRTTFAIAHRLSTLKNASRLVVIDKHSIAEFGTHDELLEKKGIYYGLVKAQLEMAKVS